ncbi:MAG: sugar phosphate isomerase/epimerase family protein [Terriglobia bacterium]|jgi:sugar phosphate isomerase/epimerase
MKTAFDRRGFLQAAGFAAASSLVADIRAGARPAEETARPRLLTGCCAYSYGKYLEAGQMTMEDFILKAVELEVVGVDMTAYWLKSKEPAYLHNLRHLAFKHGILFSGAACGTEMCEPDAGKRAALVTEIGQWVDVAELLGVSHLRVFGGELPPGATVAQGKDWVVEVMKPACDYAAQKGVTLGIESHHGITSMAADIIEILHRVDSPYARCNLDITHFPNDPYAQIEALIPYATMTHIRDHFDEPHPDPIDLERVWQMFVKGGYQGFMAAEYESKEDPATGVPKLLAKIKVLCKKYSSV